MIYDIHNITVSKKKQKELCRLKREKRVNAFDRKSFFDDYGLEISRKDLDYPKGEQLYLQKFRHRSESPPPKSKRSRVGKNRGNPKVCSHCRPQISNRMLNYSILNREMRDLNKFFYET